MDQTILNVVNSQPYYIEIFKDMLAKKTSPNDLAFESIAFEKIKGTLDLIELQDKILKSEKLIGSKRDGKRLMSYNQKDILKIMKYKKKHNLTVAEVASKFNVSRSTIFNWIRKKVSNEM
jgi:DNA-binding XRE family transcriptional regulator